MNKILEKIKRQWILRKELIKHKKFLNECIKESKKIKDFKDFNPELENIFSQLISIPGSNLRFHPVYWILNNNYNNLYNGILGLRRHTIDLFAWINVYESESDENEKCSMLVDEIENSSILTFNSIYSFKEKVIYAVVVISWYYQKIIEEPLDWKLKDDSKINIGILRDHFSDIEGIKPLLPKIEKIHRDFHVKPLVFRHKYIHRISPGIEKYGGQNYKIELTERSIKVGFGVGESIKLEEIKPKIRESYCDCIDLFYEFENYCVDYLKVKKWIKTT